MTSPADDRSDLPIDSDSYPETAAQGSRVARAAHVRPANIALVFVGGAVGTAIRFGLIEIVPGIGSLPVTVFLINVVGAFVLGLLLDSLARRGPDGGRRQRVRLLVGTGVLGGFTTYSTLAVGTVVLLQSGLGGVAVVYALGTVVVGALATLAGITLGATAHRRRESAS
ncbi:MAG: CrcB family protein [Subtercola sp.]|nr:CrcB family protein [Subtercola sp.]